MLSLDRIFINKWAIPTVLMIPIYHWASVCMFFSLQSVTGKWQWWLTVFNEHFKYIILLHLCQEIAQTPSLEIKQICSILLWTAGTICFIEQKSFNKPYPVHMFILSKSVYVLTSLWKCGCYYIINSILLLYFVGQVVDYMVWDIFAGDIGNRIYQLLHPLSNTLLNDTAPIIHNNI